MLLLQPVGRIVEYARVLGATEAEAEDADIEKLLAPLRAAGRAVTLEQILKSSVTADMQLESSSLWREVASLDCLCTGYMEHVTETEVDDGVEDDDVDASNSASVDPKSASAEEGSEVEFETVSEARALTEEGPRELKVGFPSRMFDAQEFDLEVYESSEEKEEKEEEMQNSSEKDEER